MSDAAAGRQATDPKGTDQQAPLDFACPRCGEPTSARFYGPCAPCTATLRATLGNAQRDVEIGAYEPKMNVTPNQVATKD